MLDLTRKSARKLRHALLGNAAFSAACAVMIIFAHDTVTGWLGLESLSLRALGYALLAFSAYLVWMSRSRRLPRHLVTGVVAGDWAWVVGSLLLVVWQYHTFSLFGVFLILDVALAVMAFAIWQQRGLRRLAG